MTYSHPLIWFDIPSSVVVCGEAALFFNAEQPTDLANKLEEIINSSTLVEKLKEHGVSVLKNYLEYKVHLKPSRS
jgi:hypothetical protein